MKYICPKCKKPYKSPNAFLKHLIQVCEYSMLAAYSELGKQN